MGTLSLIERINSILVLAVLARIDIHKKSIAHLI